MTIKGSWENYRKIVIHPEATPDQLALLEQTFYAGFISMFEVNAFIGNPNVSETRGILLLEEINKEIKQYMKDRAEAATKQN